MRHPNTLDPFAIIEAHTTIATMRAAADTAQASDATSIATFAKDLAAIKATNPNYVTFHPCTDTNRVLAVWDIGSGTVARPLAGVCGMIRHHVTLDAKNFAIMSDMVRKLVDHPSLAKGHTLTLARVMDDGSMWMEQRDYAGHVRTTTNSDERNKSLRNGAEDIASWEYEYTRLKGVLNLTLGTFKARFNECIDAAGYTALPDALYDITNTVTISAPEFIKALGHVALAIDLKDSRERYHSVYFQPISERNQVYLLGTNGARMHIGDLQGVQWGPTESPCFGLELKDAQKLARLVGNEETIGFSLSADNEVICKAGEQTFIFQESMQGAADMVSSFQTSVPVGDFAGFECKPSEFATAVKAVSMNGERYTAMRLEVTKIGLNVTVDCLETGMRTHDAKLLTDGLAVACLNSRFALDMVAKLNPKDRLNMLVFPMAVAFQAGNLSGVLAGRGCDSGVHVDTPCTDSNLNARDLVFSKGGYAIPPQPILVLAPTPEPITLSPQTPAIVQSAPNTPICPPAMVFKPLVRAEKRGSKWVAYYGAKTDTWRLHTLCALRGGKARWQWLYYPTEAKALEAAYKYALDHIERFRSVWEERAQGAVVTEPKPNVFPTPAITYPPSAAILNLPRARARWLGASIIPTAMAA